MLKLYHNFNLKNYNTFGFEIFSSNFFEYSESIDLISFLKSAPPRILILGGGSNIVFRDNYKGTIIHAISNAIEIIKYNQDCVLIKASSGVEWDKLVEYTVNKGFYGLENLSYIPGTVGASPVQNIGAYGIEVKDVISQVEFVSVEDFKVYLFNNEQCKFGYRDSVFKKALRNKAIITNVWFKLKTKATLNTNYSSITEEISKFDEANLKNMRQAIINIRQSKLPDPKVYGNCGSFFKNPIVSINVAEIIKQEYPDFSYFIQNETAKLSAAWLIDKTGLKGFIYKNSQVHKNQPLVLINLGKSNGNEIFDLSEIVIDKVNLKFKIKLEREADII